MPKRSSEAEHFKLIEHSTTHGGNFATLTGSPYTIELAAENVALKSQVGQLASHLHILLTQIEKGNLTDSLGHEFRNNQAVIDSAAVINFKLN